MEHSVSVVKRSTKIRKVGVEFRDLIDFEMPLWRDVFSVIFEFLSPQDLNRFLRASKELLELVKERAVFNLVLNVVEKTKFALRNFYCRGIGLGLDLDHSNEFLPLILRQRFLQTIETGGKVLDFRVFLKRNESGRLIFPHFEKVIFSNDRFDSCHFWEFLKGFPKRIGFFSEMRRFGSASEKRDSIFYRGSDLKKLATLGKYTTFKCHLPFKDDQGCPENYELNTSYLEVLSSIDTKKLILFDIEQTLLSLGQHGYNKVATTARFFSYVNALKDNRLLKQLRLGSKSFMFEQNVERFMDILAKQGNFPLLSTVYLFGCSEDVIFSLFNKTKQLLRKPTLTEAQFLIYFSMSIDVIEDDDYFAKEFTQLCIDEKWRVAFTPRGGGDHVYMVLSFNRIRPK